MQNFPAQLIEDIECSHLDQNIILAIIEEYDLTHYHPIEDIVEIVERVYCGTYGDKDDYAYELIEDCYTETKENALLLRYFDYDAFTRDLELSGDMSFIPYDGRYIAINNHEF